MPTALLPIWWSPRSRQVPAFLAMLAVVLLFSGFCDDDGGSLTGSTSRL